MRKCTIKKAASSPSPKHRIKYLPWRLTAVSVLPTKAERDPGRGWPEQSGARIDALAKEEQLKFMSGAKLFGKEGGTGQGVTRAHREAKIERTQMTADELFGPPNDERQV